MFLNLRARKVIRDLWGNKSRSLLVIVTIMVGVFAVGTISRTWVLLSRNLTDNYQAVNPTHATLYTEQTFDETVVEEITRMAAVREAEGRYRLRSRVAIGPDEWRQIEVTSRADYEAIAINKLRPESGAWPPPRRGVLLERSFTTLASLEKGDPIRIKLDDGRLKEFTLSGTVYDAAQIPSGFSYVMYGYVSRDTMESLSGKQGYNTLDLIVSRPDPDKAHIEQVVEEVSEKLEAHRLIILTKDIPTPGQHKMDSIVQAVLLLLGILSGWALVLNTLLVVNIISALLTQQIPQIGSLKAIGSRNSQIILLYLGLVALLSVTTLLLTIPINIVLSRFMATLFAGMINFEITSVEMPFYIYLVEFLAGVVMPCLVALYPILKSARMTVREAIGRTGAQTVNFGSQGIEKLLGLIQGLSAILLYSFRNIFRRKVRMTLALLALSAAGAIFIAVVSVRASFRSTLDKVAGYWQEEINISLYDPYRFKQLERLTAQVSGISQIEARLKANAFRIYADDSESTHTLDVVGVDPRSAFLQPELLAGRWLQPDDKQAAVINVDFLELEPNTQVGDQLRLNIEGRESDWRVVGIVTSQVVGSREPLMAPIAYVDYTELTQVMGRYGDANQILIQAPGNVSDQVAQALEQNLKRHNIGIASVLLHDDIRWAMENGFEILFNVLQIMSVIFGAVGGLGLMSMMSLNVLERTREIGIIRSIGGVRSQLAQMVMVESIFVGVLSWAIGSILAYPLSFYLANILGVTLFRVPFNHTFPLTGSLLWLGIVVILAIFSSLLPAHNASQLSISQTLMYE